VKPENALPAPGKTTISQEEAAKRLAAVKDKLSRGKLNHHWPIRIVEDPKSVCTDARTSALLAIHRLNLDFEFHLNEMAKQYRGGLKELVANIYLDMLKDTPIHSIVEAV
jgi:hypothetical protein